MPSREGLRDVIANALWRLTANYEQQRVSFDSVPDGVKVGFNRKADYLINEVGLRSETWNSASCPHQWEIVRRDVSELTALCLNCERSKTISVPSV